MYPKRVPTCLPVARQQEAVAQVRAGRSVHQVAAEFSVSEGVILELWNRDTIRRTQEFLKSLEVQMQNMYADLRGSRKEASREPGREIARESAA